MSADLEALQRLGLGDQFLGAERVRRVVAGDGGPRRFPLPHEWSQWTARERAAWEPLLRSSPSGLRVLEAALSLQVREDEVVAQLLSAVVTAFAIRLDEAIAARARTELETLADTGFLVEVESLLSTAGREIGMLEDLVSAVRILSRFSFQFVRGEDAPRSSHSHDASSAPRKADRKAERKADRRVSSAVPAGAGAGTGAGTGTGAGEAVGAGGSGGSGPATQNAMSTASSEAAKKVLLAVADAKKSRLRSVFVSAALRAKNLATKELPGVRHDVEEDSDSSADQAEEDHDHEHVEEGRDDAPSPSSSSTTTTTTTTTTTDTEEDEEHAGDEHGDVHEGGDLADEANDDGEDEEDDEEEVDDVRGTRDAFLSPGRTKVVSGPRRRESNTDAIAAALDRRPSQRMPPTASAGPSTPATSGPRARDHAVPGSSGPRRRESNLDALEAALDRPGESLEVRKGRGDEDGVDLEEEEEEGEEEEEEEKVGARIRRAQRRGAAALQAAERAEAQAGEEIAEAEAVLVVGQLFGTGAVLGAAAEAEAGTSDVAASELISTVAVDAVGMAAAVAASQPTQAMGSAAANALIVAATAAAAAPAATASGAGGSSASTIASATTPETPRKRISLADIVLAAARSTDRERKASTQLTAPVTAPGSPNRRQKLAKQVRLLRRLSRMYSVFAESEDDLDLDFGSEDDVEDIPPARLPIVAQSVQRAAARLASVAMEAIPVVRESRLAHEAWLRTAWCAVLPLALRGAALAVIDPQLALPSGVTESLGGVGGLGGVRGSRRNLSVTGAMRPSSRGRQPARGRSATESGVGQQLLQAARAMEEDDIIPDVPGGSERPDSPAAAKSDARPKLSGPKLRERTAPPTLAAQRGRVASAGAEDSSDVGGAVGAVGVVGVVGVVGASGSSFSSSAGAPAVPVEIPRSAIETLVATHPSDALDLSNVALGLTTLGPVSSAQALAAMDQVLEVYSSLRPSASIAAAPSSPDASPSSASSSSAPSASASPPAPPHPLDVLAAQVLLRSSGEGGKSGGDALVTSLAVCGQLESDAAAARVGLLLAHAGRSLLASAAEVSRAGWHVEAPGDPAHTQQPHTQSHTATQQAAALVAATREAGEEKGSSSSAAAAVAAAAASAQGAAHPPHVPAGWVDETVRRASFAADGSYMRVVLTIPARVFDLLPAALTRKELALVPLVFTQGINEQQSFVNAVGSTAQSIQREVNLASLYRLARFANTWGERLAGSAMRKLDLDMLALASEVRAEALVGGKRPRILQLAGDVVRQLRGSRITCCKSGKDRTSMSVCLEEARILQQNHGLRASRTLAVANFLREHGVRRTVCRKNIGKPVYAFNAFQSALLPREYKPPSSTLATGGGVAT
jgi:hypothetical protein